MLKGCATVSVWQQSTGKSKNSLLQQYNYLAPDSTNVGIGPREKRATGVLNPHAFDHVPPTPSANECQELALAPPDGNDNPDGA